MDLFHQTDRKANLCDGDDDDDDDDEDDELFLINGWKMKGAKPYFQPGPLSEILNIANLRHATSRIWTCPGPEFCLCWVKFCSSDNQYNTAPLIDKNWLIDKYTLMEEAKND